MLSIFTTVPARLYLSNQPISCLDILIADGASVYWDRDVGQYPFLDPIVWIDEGLVCEGAKYLFVWNPTLVEWSIWDPRLYLTTNRASRIRDAHGWLPRAAQTRYLRLNSARPLSELES